MRTGNGNEHALLYASSLVFCSLASRPSASLDGHPLGHSKHQHQRPLRPTPPCFPCRGHGDLDGQSKSRGLLVRCVVERQQHALHSVVLLLHTVPMALLAAV